MTMGNRIRQARIDAGLSQRQLAGDMMTRNMLSALEHDGANPSVATLKYLSERLCKPIGYFLGEEAPQLPYLAEIKQIRVDYEHRAYAACLKKIESLGENIFQPELQLLEILCLLEMAKEARECGKLPYSRELLSRCEGVLEQCQYMRKELRKRWAQESALSAMEKERMKYIHMIPTEDESLMLRAEGAIKSGAYGKAANLLEAVENRRSVNWNLLRGEIYILEQEYEKAAECYHRIEEDKPQESAVKLEICYREMGNYKMAYYYAKKEKIGKNRI